MHCTNCGVIIENSDKFCKSCGFNLSQQTTSSHGTASEPVEVKPVEVKPVQAKPAKAENSICPVCNTAILPGDASLSCSACGIKYHPECWKTNLGCSTYGCPMVGSLKPRPKPSVKIEPAYETPKVTPITTTALPYSNYADVPVYRRQWVFWLMYLTIVFNPIAILILLTGDVYYTKNGEVKSFGVANRIVAGIIAAIWLYAIFFLINAAKNPTQLFKTGQQCEEKQDYANAIKYYKMAGEQGHALAQYKLGCCYFNGQGVEKDEAEAVKWSLKSAEQGNAMAQYALGSCYYNGQGVAQDEAEAVKWYRQAAEQGNAKAQHGLGVCYFMARGVAKDYAEAVRWTRKAAEQGLADAQYNLGVAYFNGNGVPKDESEALKWHSKSAEQGNAKAQAALEELKTAQPAPPPQQTPDELFNLGCQCVEKKDYTNAVKYYQQSADKGHAGAQNNLGNCYYYGQGVSLDYTKAVEWYRKAAEQGDADAQYWLGDCYEKGRGIAKYPEEAAKWYLKAAEQGNAEAQYNLGGCYYNGAGVPQDMIKAVEWLGKAAQKGHVKAQYWLGECYEHGDGVAKDMTKAAWWYRKAAEQGNKDAQAALEKGRF